jgi:hypothetical protein
MVSHPTIRAFRLSPVSPQINALWIFSISSKQLFGIGINIIGYIGIAWITDLASVILPAKDSCLAFHPASLALTFSIKYWKSWTLGDLPRAGTPR